MGRTRLKLFTGWWMAAVIACGLTVAACGATLERTARSELEDDGYSSITLRPSKRATNIFSFDATRDGEPCRGEIEVRDQMGHSVATVTSQCGEAIR